MSKSNYAARVAQFAAAVDVKGAILDALSLPDGEHEVFHSQVLVAQYIQPEKTKGGIILTDKSKDEDIYQGSIGLVVAVGPLAFQDTAHIKFGGKSVAVGDWVMFRKSDGLSLFINQAPCILFEDASIKMRVLDPELYY